MTKLTDTIIGKFRNRTGKVKLIEHDTGQGFSYKIAMYYNWKGEHLNVVTKDENVITMKRKFGECVQLLKQAKESEQGNAETINKILQEERRTGHATVGASAN